MLVIARYRTEFCGSTLGSLVMLLSLCVSGICGTAIGAEPRAVSPEWWRQTRAIYAAHALSGAGGALLKFPGQDIRRLQSFTNLPVMLTDAQRLGAKCIYLVDYWEGGYEHKGDYIPRSDLGGPKAFQQGIAAVQARGGRVILYLEAFIIHRQSKVGREHGRDWAMRDRQGRPYGYYGRTQYYLMYPNRGSGWTEYLCARAEQLVRDYGVDGFHLDSYGLQWNWRDYHPQHPGASDPRKFNQGAIHLVQSLRARIQRIRPEAVVMLEGCERPELLKVCDGGQVDYAAWQYSPLKTLAEKPWFAAHTYKAFTAHFSLPEMERVWDAGYNLMLTPWWLQSRSMEADFRSLRKVMDDKRDWYKRILKLWHWDNLLYANQSPRPADVDLFALRRDLEKQAHIRKTGPYETAAYRAAVAAYEPLVRRLRSRTTPRHTPAEYLRELLGRAATEPQR